MKSDDKNVIIPMDKFQDMLDLIKELREANKLLNNQIDEYNKKFANKEKRNE